MSDEAIGALIAVIVIGSLMAVGVWWNLAVWSECRETNSVMYCLRVITR